MTAAGSSVDDCALDSAEGNVTLSTSDKAVLLNEQGLLHDKHIACGQFLLKQQFPHIGGLRPTVLQQKKLDPLPPKSLQILHVTLPSPQPGHWIAASTVSCENDDIVLYDSLFSAITDETKINLAQLICTVNPEFTVRISGVTKQSGSSECGLYALAYITHVAFGQDPSLFTFRQSEMRNHFLACIENGNLQPFPVVRGRRLPSVPKTVTIKVHCYCRCPYIGAKMVLCDGVCQRWFHIDCLNTSAVQLRKKWFCTDCRSSSK